MVDDITIDSLTFSAMVTNDECDLSDVIIMVAMIASYCINILVLILST